MVAQWIRIMVRIRLMKSSRCLMVERFHSFVGLLVMLVVRFFNDVFRLWIVIASMIIFSGPIIVAV